MKRLLQNYKRIADSIATLFHPYVEVVIHDLATQQIVYIVNDLSKREIGSPSLLETFELESDKPVVGPYDKLNWDGRKLKSVCVAIKEDSRVVGLMCINLDVSVFETVFSALSLFLKPENMLENPDRVFKDDWQEKINYFVHAWLQENRKNINNLVREEKQKLIELIDRKGGFKGKNAAIYVAGILGLSRATVYKYLKKTKS